MARFAPKAIPEEQWKLLHGGRTYAFRADNEDNAIFRLGKGKSIYLEVVPTKIAGRIINMLEFDTGETTLIRKLSNLSRVLVGRTAECDIKIVHAYVSRQHMEMSLDGNILLVKDLGSVNGTYFCDDCVMFDVDKYLETYSLDQAVEQTLDHIHEAFGANLDEFLKKHLKEKETKNDIHTDENQ